MAVVQKRRERQTTRYIHRIFWRAMLVDKRYFIFTILMHVPAFFIAHVYIPLQVAYGLQAIVTQQFDRIPYYVVVILIATIAFNLLLGIGTWAFNRDGVVGGIYIQKLIFKNYLSKDYDFYSDNFVGALGAQAARFRDAFIKYNHIALFDIPRVLTIVIAGIVVIGLNSIMLAIITSVCMAFVLSYTIISSSMRLKYRRLVSEATSELSGVMGDALSHGVTVKSFGTEAYESKRLLSSLNNWQKVQLKSWDLFTPANTGRNILNTITICILLILTSQLYKSGTISIAIVALVQLYVVKLVAATLDIADIIKSYEEVMGNAYEPAVTMQITSQVHDPEKPIYIKGSINELGFENVSYHYPDAKRATQAISDFSLHIPKGEKVGIVGRSGSGKTTLTKLLLRFMDVDSGAIKINSVDITDITQHELRNIVGYVPQEPLLFHRSVKENIAYALPDATEADVLKAAKLARVDEFVNDLPNGYDTLVGERGVKLSGGQRQRVAIARAILKDAPILVLDEATSSLDSESEQYIQTAFNNLMKGRTTIVIAHRLSTIQKMDTIIVLDKGKITEQGSHKELLQKDGLYAKLWAHQSGGFLED